MKGWTDIALALVPALAAVTVGAAAGWPWGLVAALVIGTAAGTLRRRRRDVTLTTVSDHIERLRRDPSAELVETPPEFAAVITAAEALAASFRDVALRDRLLGAFPLPALLFDRRRRLIAASEAARTYGFSAGVGVTATRVLGAAELTTLVAEAALQDRLLQIDARIGDGTVAAVAVPVDGDVLLVVEDRTRERDVDAVRRDFVSNASHELKTPVAGIQALVDAIVTTLADDPARAAAMAGRLQDEVGRLSALVRDLLDLQRLEEAPPSARIAVDLAALVREEVRSVTHIAAERDVSVRVAVPEEAVVAAVPADLRLVVSNLLDNALGYNEPGGRVDVALTRGDGTWRLTVRDTGIGIARHDLDRIFERFYRVDVARSRASGRTGLGLAIVRHAVEAHGGRISVESLLGEGSTFTVELPVSA